jgi:hypothetical protein
VVFFFFSLAQMCNILLNIYARKSVILLILRRPLFYAIKHKDFGTSMNYLTKI